MGRWALVIRAPSGACGPCAYPLSETAQDLRHSRGKHAVLGPLRATSWMDARPSINHDSPAGTSSDAKSRVV